jgi:hypothetical protein
VKESLHVCLSSRKEVDEQSAAGCEEDCCAISSGLSFLISSGDSSMDVVVREVLALVFVFNISSPSAHQSLIVLCV